MHRRVRTRSARKLQRRVRKSCLRSSQKKEEQEELKQHRRKQRHFKQILDIMDDMIPSKPYVFVRLAGDSGASTAKAQAEDAALCEDSAIPWQRALELALSQSLSLPLPDEEVDDVVVE